MKLLEIIYGSQLSLAIPVSICEANSATPIFDDIIDFAVIMKADAKDTDEDAVFLKTLVEGGISLMPIEEGQGYFLHFSPSDYGIGKLEAGNIYDVFIGFKTASMSSFEEIKNVKPNRIKILADGIRA